MRVGDYQNVAVQVNSCQHFLINLYNQLGGLHFQRRPPKQEGALRVVATLSSTPSRLPKLLPVVESLLKQTMPVAMIYLNIPYDSEPHHQARHPVPPELQLMHESSLPVQIVRCKDYGPANKLIPTLTHETDPNTLLITGEDDREFAPTTVEKLVSHILNWPHAAYSFAGHIIDEIGDGDVAVRSAQTPAYDGHPHGVDILGPSLGAIFRRDFFNLHEPHHNIQDIPEECWEADDIWFSYQLVRAGIPRIKLLKADAQPFPSHVDVHNQHARNRCAQSLLAEFQQGWTSTSESCAVEFKEIQTKLDGSFEVNPLWLPESDASPCTKLYLPTEGGMDKLPMYGYMTAGTPLVSPNKAFELHLTEEGTWCVKTNRTTDIATNTALCPPPAAPNPDEKMNEGTFLLFQDDFQLVVYRGTAPWDNHGVAMVVPSTHLCTPTRACFIAIDDDGDVGIFMLGQDTHPSPLKLASIQWV